MRTVPTLCVLACLTVIATAADADPISAGDSIRFADAPGTTGGGEFLVTVNELDSFITFCLQRTEYIDYSTTFVIGGVSPYALSDAAAQGGDALQRDWLSPQTAWLYTHFRNGTLVNYDFAGALRWQSANALQKAIWWFEGELASNPSNGFVTAANLAVVNGWTGIGDVRAINLFFPNGREAQDQLVLVSSAPEPASVPEPASLGLVALGVGLVLRRRWSKRCPS